MAATWWWVVVMGLAPARAQAQTAADSSPALRPAPNPAGTWKGPLSIPGGSVPIELKIVQAGANKLIVTLDLPSKKLSQVPASLTFRHDTLVFFAPTIGCRYVCLQVADGQELQGIWTQPGLRVPLVLSRFVPGQAAVAAASTVAPVALTYHIEPVTVTSEPGHVPLAGTLSIPDGAGPFPAAVLLSDMGAQDRDARQGNYRFFADIAAALARQGIAVLRLDDRGVGESGGNSNQTTTTDRVSDAQAALNFLRLRPTLNPARTGLIGHGEGGNVALLAAAQPLPPSFVVTLAASGVVGLELLASQPEPPASPADTARLGAARRQAWADVLARADKLRASGSNAAQVDTYLAQQRLKARSEDRKEAEATLKFRRTMLEIVRQTINNEQAQAIGMNMLRQRYPSLDPALGRARVEQITTPWYRSYLRFDPQATLDEVTCPVLLLNGTDDPEVNAAVNLTALEKGLKGNKRVASRRLPGINHWFQTPASERLASTDGTLDAVISPLVLETIRSWVLEQGGK